MIRRASESLRQIALRPKAARAVDETLRDWEFEWARTRGLRRLCVDIRGAFALTMVMLRVGGPDVTVSDAAWLSTRVALPFVAAVAICVSGRESIRYDMLRLPFGYWPLYVASNMTLAASLLFPLLPLVLAIGVMWPGPRRHVPWGTAIVAVAIVYLALALIAGPSADTALVGLHYLTFALERGTSVSPPVWPHDAGAALARTGVSVVMGAIVATSIACFATAARNRANRSAMWKAVFAATALGLYVASLAVPELVFLRWFRPDDIAVWFEWRFIVGQISAATIASAGALLIRVKPATRVPPVPGAAA